MTKLWSWIDSEHTDHSFHKYLLGIYHETNAMRGTGDTAVSKWDKKALPAEVIYLTLSQFSGSHRTTRVLWMSCEMRRKPRIERRGAPTFCQIDLRSSTPQRTLKRSLQDRRKIGGMGGVCKVRRNTDIQKKRRVSCVKWARDQRLWQI